MMTRKLERFSPEKIYQSLIIIVLTPEQIQTVQTPPHIYSDQTEVLAVHWHPEYVPMPLIKKRIDGSFPNRKTELIIPTNHNVIDSYNDYCGVEVDCYSKSFNRKVQLLIHFSKDKLSKTSFFKKILKHTFHYRSTQLHEFIDAILEEKSEPLLQKAAVVCGADKELIAFVREHTSTLKDLIRQFESQTPPEILKNKIVRNYFDALREFYPDVLINRAQAFLKCIKEEVKAHFDLTYFYETQEIIEEVRGFGGGIVIPHPEQFWPILLAGYDVDGIEVWNPQSRDFTEFLIQAVTDQNKSRRRKNKELLIFMGDDTHMSEKIRDPLYRDPEKSSRELGVQPAWEDPAIELRLRKLRIGRQSTIEEYKHRIT